MIVYGLHLGDKIDSSCPSSLSDPTASMRTSPHPILSEAPSFPANPGLRSSSGSADSGEQVLKPSPSGPRFVFQSLSVTLCPPR